MIVEKTDAQHPDFKALVVLLDKELAITDGNEHAFYHQFNGLEDIKHVLIATIDNVAIACGAFKKLNETSVEIKRMYTLPNFRGKGIASQLLLHLEDWAKEIGFSSTILETGKRQPDAIALYKKNGYTVIPNYGQYVGKENSVCFEKKL